MSEDQAAAAAETAPTPEPAPDVEKQAFLDRLNKESSRRKDAEKRLAALEARLEEKEAEGLPELERERKARERAERDLAEARAAREESEKAIQAARAERWVIAAARNFQDPDDATRFVDLSALESPEDAERAVKKVAKAKPHLLKSEDKPIPGRVLENGRPAAPAVPQQNPDEEFARGMLEQINAMRQASGYSPGSGMFE